MIQHQKALLLALSFSVAVTASYAAVQRDTTLAPVETQSPNSTYKPAFKGQTRIGGVKTKTPYSVTVINSSLKNPWGIHVLPDGRFLVTEKAGSMRILKANGEFDKQITGFPAVLYRAQGGLLDVTIDPAFTTNRMVYWGYTEQTDGGSLLAIAKGKLSADETKLDNVEVIYRATPAYKGNLQYGARIVFDKQGNLFVSTGERSGSDIRMKAQDLSAGIGKIIHITKAGKAVAGGPFAGKANALPEVYAYGLRNPDGLAWNPATGELWEAEFGPRGGDEINIIKPGRNYGWPVVTYGIEYSGEKVGDGIQQKEGVTQPVYYWDPTISPGGITFYTGNIAEWKNNLFVGGLSGSHIARLVIRNNKVVGEERLLRDRNERWRAVVTGKDGALYGLTDSGKLYRIAKK
ncbi:PQQ-dependent sugar dehydrogenase [Mucilaginibacter rigui]|uniref:PQQ-dependent sugar dehydrogenase n=1 Tax=Mucilaginibacter rigui TaxID=534635 RepID=A0ABR7X5B1_9SPHI|nr:PQQ-dependent sugar dehydrogenase [Mucilaginibacter rigui]MBD1385753.1 PQQ-dependent sugar dehydrogenase [Mucilaginibacter rigui]